MSSAAILFSALRVKKYSTEPGVFNDTRLLYIVVYASCSQIYLFKKMLHVDSLIQCCFIVTPCFSHFYTAKLCGLSFASMGDKVLPKHDLL